MSGYFISPREETDWRIDGATLARALKAKWSSAQIEAVNNPSSLYRLEWTIDAELPSRIDGTLTKAGQTVYLEGDVEACAAFAVWLRGLVSSAPPLIFYDEGYTNDVELTPDKTAIEISRPFLAP